MTPRLAELEKMAGAGLERLFADSREPTDDELLGDHDGCILAGRPFRAAGLVWAGKRIVRDRQGRLCGANRVRLGARIITAVTFSVELARSPLDKVVRCSLLYGDVGLLRDELVWIEPGLLLGRGYWARLPRAQLYFALREVAPC